MASGASLPYALRHNKFVDRRIFVDLLSHISRWRPADDYVYLSMGGNSLEDHKLVHAQLGLKKLISIDKSAHVVARQKFNRPVEVVKCIEMTTSDLAATFRTKLVELGFGGEDPVVVWFDYTSPSELGDQLKEFVQLLNTMASGDVVRITVNAHLPSLVDSRSLPLAEREPEVLAEARLKKLSERLGDHMPRAEAGDMTPEGLALLIAEAFRTVALDAFPATDPHIFQPISAVRYSDGQQMLSVTGIVLGRTEVEEFWARTRLRDWPYACEDWGSVESLAIPELTLRERLLLDQIPVDQPLAVVRQRLGFDFEGKEPGTEKVIAQYRKNGRFYPHFHYVPV